MRRLIGRNLPSALYARLGPPYLERYYSVLYLSAVVLGGPPIYVTLVLTTHGTTADYAVAFATGTGSVLAALWLCIQRERHILDPAIRWRPGDAPAVTTAAWRATVIAVPATLVRNYLTCLLLSGLPWALLLALLFDLGAGAVVLAIGGIAVFSMYPVVVNAAGFELFLTPLKRDLGRHLPADYRIARPYPSLRHWLLWTMPVITVGNGLFVAIYATAVEDLTSRIVATLVVTVLWTLSSLYLVIRLILQPIGELGDVTARIRAGDLSARTAPEREDELGMLQLEFNQMTDDLARSRERLITMREEERRRLRRDLHDGLGAALAGVTVQLKAALRALDRDPARVEPLLTSASDAVEEMLGEVRELVYGLRPPVLDALGLPGALRDHAGGLRGPDAPAFTIEEVGELGELPAAVEIAALRIAQEAMTNVVRHAEADRCTVELSRNGALTVCVRDDGVGFGMGIAHPGVGLVSMRERARELGGSVVIAAAPDGGTEVVAVLPAD